MAEHKIDNWRDLKYSQICNRCANLMDGYERKCKAFPKGIPMEIWVGENKHTQKHPSQKSNIVFQPRN